jgi:hypothetical protein
MFVLRPMFSLCASKNTVKSVLLNVCISIGLLPVIPSYITVELVLIKTTSSHLDSYTCLTNSHFLLKNKIDFDVMIITASLAFILLSNS